MNRQIEFDPVNGTANQEKHGLPLALAAELDWDASLGWQSRMDGMLQQYVARQSRRA